MSAALVRRGLELLGADITDSAGKKKKKQQMKMKVKKSPSAPPAGLNRIGAHIPKTGVGKASTRQQSKRSKRTLQYFLTRGTAAASHCTKKIIHQNKGRQSRDKAVSSTPQPQKPRSVFSEDEFQQFQKDYFGRVVEEQ